MNWTNSLLLILLFQYACHPSAVEEPDLRIRYIANEGVLLERGEAKVLIDALHDPYRDQYAATPPAVIDQLMQGDMAFANLDAMLVTHVHGDHFDPVLTDRLLSAKRELQLIAPQQACDSITTRGSRLHCITNRGSYDFAGLRVEAQLIQHSYQVRNHWVQNAAYLLDFAGIRVLHIGDAEVVEENFAALSAFTGGEVDVAILPFWYYTSTASADWIESSLRARLHLGVHVPVQGTKGAAAAQERFPNLRLAQAGIEDLFVSE